MASRVEQFEITTPTGTLQTAPQITSLAFQEGTIQRLELTIPGGHAGLTGIAFFHATVQVIPYRAGTFIRGDGQEMGWDLVRYPAGGLWVVRTFNTDVYDHTHHLRLLLDDIPTPAPPLVVTPQPIQPEATPDELADADQLPTEVPDVGELLGVGDQL